MVGCASCVVRCALSLNRRYRQSAAKAAARLCHQVYDHRPRCPRCPRRPRFSDRRLVPLGLPLGLVAQQPFGEVEPLFQVRHPVMVLLLEFHDILFLA